MTLEEFRDLVSAALNDLPEPLQPYLDRFEFDVSEAPPPEQPDSWSAKERLDLGPRGRYGLAAVSRVTLFKAPLEAAADSASGLRRILQAEILRQVTGEPEDEEDEDEDESDEEAT